MTWVKIDDKMPEHPKVATVGPLGGWLQVCGLAYCNRNLTDGFIPTVAAHSLTSYEHIGVATHGTGDGMFQGGYDPTCADIAQQLVAAGIWEKVPGGYQVHDYLVYQFSKADIEHKRAVDAARQGRQRQKRSGRSNGGSNEGSHGESHGVTEGVTDSVTERHGVTPQRPVPVARRATTGTAGATSASPDGPPSLSDEEAVLRARSYAALVFEDYPNLVDLRSELTDRSWVGVRLTAEQADAIIAAELEARS